MVEKVQPFKKLHTNFNTRKIDPKGPKRKPRHRGLTPAPELKKSGVEVGQKGEHYRTNSVVLKSVPFDHSTPVASLNSFAKPMRGVPCIK